jgi:hypothetical protein
MAVSFSSEIRILNALVAPKILCPTKREKDQSGEKKKRNEGERFEMGGGICFVGAGMSRILSSVKSRGVESTHKKGREMMMRR